MNTFEDSLLVELREHIAHRAADAPARTRRARRLRWSALPVGAATATAVALVLVQSPAAAYAVDRTDDGNVVVTIDKLSDAAGLQQALRADGINAVVNYDANLAPISPSGAPTGVNSDSGTSSGPTTTTNDGAGQTANGAPGTDGSQSGCGQPGPVQVAAGPNSVTFTISAADVGSTSKLFITTGGSQDSGFTALQIRWEC
jgi:hypothetical protein